MTMRLMIRGYLRTNVGTTLLWEKPLSVDSEALDGVLPALAEEHAEAMARRELGMIEIEFLDDPNPDERFFRMGVDPSGMVVPLGFDLTDKKAN